MDKNPRCFISSSTEDLKHVHRIKEFLANEGIDVFTWADTLSPGMVILEALRETLSKVDFVIVLVPSSRGRENVLFELGYIMAIGKPVISIVQKDSEFKMPSDLAGIMYLQYDSTLVEPTLHYLKSWISRILTD